VLVGGLLDDLTEPLPSLAVGREGRVRRHLWRRGGEIMGGGGDGRKMGEEKEMGEEMGEEGKGELGGTM
jgi:hypothetical protein